MTYQGTVRDGVVVFDGNDRPAEGTAVTVNEPAVGEGASMPPAVGARLLALSGTVLPGAFPDDSSAQVDHYLDGHPERWRPSSPIRRTPWH